MGLFSGSKKPKRASSTSQPKEKERRRQSSAPPRTRQPSSHNAPPPPLPWSAQHHSPPFQPAGYLPAPPGWSPSQQGQQQQQLQQQSQQPHPHYQYHRPYPPIVVNQYYLSPPSSNASSASSNAGNALCRLTGSAVNLVNDVLPGSLQVSPQLFDDGLPAWHAYGTQLLNQSAALYDQISSRFNDIMTSIDQNKFLGNEKELFTYQPQPSSSNTVTAPAHTHKRPQSPKKGKKEKQATVVASSVASGGYFAKVELYSNSRLPLDLPPLRLYIPTYPLLCLAAQYSDRVYEKPRGSERDAHVDADWKTGAKAMVIKSVPMDHMNTIVFAIRGTATFMDWAVNLNMAPTSPQGFLDDASNFCHSGFLSVARRMIKPVAARLRQLLEENPSRATYSLLITGHSAGGAVAALLYSHMLSTSAEAQSELTALTGAFRRIHCITFGTPPVSLVPLKKPDRPELKKWLFMTFVNEGDPVARADKGYVKSLLELLAAPAPGNTSTLVGTTSKSDGKSDSKSDSKKSKSSSSSKSSSKSKTQSPKKRSSRESTRDRSKDRSKDQSKESPPMWNVPRCTLSSAGRIIVLRSGDPTSRIKTKKTVEERLDEGVIAQVATDEDLRGVIWGDPVCHVMRLYKGRIDTLAVGAVTAAGH